MLLSEDPGAFGDRLVLVAAHLSHPRTIHGDEPK